MRKLLLSTLIAAMVVSFGLFGIGATGDIAKAFTDISGHEAEAELTLMAALGIFTGEQGVTGAVKPDDFITRAQFCKVVVLATGKGSTAAGLSGLKPEFVDEVPSWAWGYVNTAYYMGIIGGYPDKTFRANNPVTYGEALTMLVKAVPGHAAQVPAGVWPYNFLFYAVDSGFTGDVECLPNLPCTRGDMARLLFNTMQVEHLNAKGEGQDKAYLWDGVNLYEGILTAYDADSITIDGYGGALALGDPVYVVGGDDYDDLLGLNVVAVTKSGKVVFLWKTEGKSLSGVFDKLYTDTATQKTYIVLKDGTKVPYDDAFDVILNEKDGSGKGDLAAGDELVINTNDKGLATVVFALRWDLVCLRSGSDPNYTYTHGKADIVTKVEKSKAGPPAVNTKITVGKREFHYYDYNDAAWYALDDTVFEITKAAKVTINGVAASRDDLAEYDVVKIATYGALGYHAAGDIIAVAAYRNVAEGTVTAVRTGTTGTEVTLKSGDTSKTYKLDWTYLQAPTVSQLLKYALGADGKLFWNISYGTSNPVALVTDKVSETTSSGTKYFLVVDNKGTSQTYECKDQSVYDAATAGRFAVLTIDAGTGKVTAVEDMGDPTGWSDAEVKAVGADNLTLWDDPHYLFIEEPVVVYSLTDDGYTYIGLAGLDEGDEVFYKQATVGSTTFTVIYRDDK